MNTSAEAYLNVAASSCSRACVVIAYLPWGEFVVQRGGGATLEDADPPRAPRGHGLDRCWADPSPTVEAVASRVRGRCHGLHPGGRSL